MNRADDPDVRAGDAAQLRMNSYWSARADVYDQHQQRPQRRDRDRSAWADVLAEVLPPKAPRGTQGPRGLDVLDVGTGSGYLAFVLADLGHRVTGIDLADGMLARARDRARDRARRNSLAVTAGPRGPAPEFLRGDAVAPPFPARSFDAVVNRYVVWTLREPRAALRAWCRLLQPGGTVVVIDGNWFPHGLLDGTGNGAGGEFRRWYDASVSEHLPLAAAPTDEELPRLLQEAGFVDVHTRPLHRFLELDREFGAAPGHLPTLQHLTTARRPGPPEGRRPPR